VPCGFTIQSSFGAFAPKSAAVLQSLHSTVILVIVDEVSAT
jgi:hypothetical protein